ncbi:cytochrome c biogenesis protein CcdA, partial [Microbacterium sp.]|uniref:cytochrome c biogenesis protein CcdA n=1 Tax=Microbacterium sp. TaxID=51671 RepID=UPI0028B16623
MSLRRVLLVALGGTLGTAARLGLGLLVPDLGGFPLAVLPANVLGALLIGVVAARLPASAELRLLLGTGLFVAGFAFVFVSTGALFGGLGALLMQWSRPLTIVAGVLAIVLGLVFAGVVRFGQNTVRLSTAPGF